MNCLDLVLARKIDGAEGAWSKGTSMQLLTLAFKIRFEGFESLRQIRTLLGMEQHHLDKFACNPLTYVREHRCQRHVAQS